MFTSISCREAAPNKNQKSSVIKVMTALNKMGSKFLLTLGVLGASMGVIGCGDDPVNPEGGGTGPGPKTEVKRIDLERAKLGIIEWNQADSTFIFQKVNGDNIEKWTVSGSKKAVGGRVNLTSPILSSENLLSITDGTENDKRNIIMPYPAPMGVKLSAEGSNSSIAQSTNNEVVIKTASYLECAGLIVKNVRSLEQVKNTFSNQSIEWKLIANPASQLQKVAEAPNATFNVKVSLN